MKSRRISTAISLLVLTALAPAAWSVGDPNTDSGVGSAASRGPFGFSNNNDAVYDTPANTYGVYRDAYGGLRDSGMIPDNLTTNVPVPTWEETHQARGPMPGGGAPGGLAGGGFGGFGGMGGLGGLPGMGFGALGAFAGAGLGLAGLGGGSLSGVTGSMVGVPGAGQFPVGNGISPMRFNGATNAALGLNGAGPTAQVPRTAYGFFGTPGTYFPSWPTTQQRFLGPGSGFLPFNQTTVTNRTANGISDDYSFSNTSAGPFEQRRRMQTVNGRTTTRTTSYYNGNTWITTSVLGGNPENTAGTGLTVEPDTSTTGTPNAPPRNYTYKSFQDSNNGFTNPAVPNTAWTQRDNNDIAQGQPGFLGSGFATPATSGDQRSAFFSDQQATGSLGAGFATPGTSGSQRSVYFPNNFSASGSLGAGFATPATSGSERSAIYSNTNNTFGNASGFGGGGGLGGISAGRGNRAGVSFNASASGGYGSSGGSGSSATTSGTMSGENDVAPGSGVAGTGIRRRNGINPQFGIGGGTASGVFGPVTQGGGPQVGTMGERMAVGPTPLTNPYAVSGTSMQRIIPRGTAGSGATASNAKAAAISGTGAAYMATPISSYVNERARSVRRAVQSGVVAGVGPTGNIATNLEPALAKMHLTPSQAIGRVIGSMRYANGDIITYGSKGTLRLAPDNSGSITFNSGEVLTFKSATPAVRWVALRSTLLF